MNNLDNLYHKKLHDREFPFRQSYWDDAEQLIIEDEKRRRKGLYFWLSGLLVLLFAGGALIWTGSPEPEVKRNSPVQADNSSAKSGLEEIKQAPTQKATIPEQDRPEMFNPGSTILQPQKTASNPANFAEKSGKKPSGQNPKPENETPDPGYSVPVQQEQTIPGKDPVIYTDETDENLTPVETLSDMEDERITETTPFVSNEIQETAPTSPVETTGEAIEENPQQKKAGSPGQKSFNLGVRVSALAYPATTNEKTWIGAGIGLVGEYNLRPSLSLNAELLYTRRTGSFGSASSSEQIQYSFGKRTVFYNMNPHSLHFAELPLYARFKTGKHGFEAGMTLSYLAGVFGNIEKQTSLFPWEITDENDFTTETYGNGWQDKGDFNMLSAGILLGYRYYPTNRLAVGLRSNYRFGNLVKNAENAELILQESGPLHVDISLNWFFIK